MTYSLRELGERLPAFIERCDWLPHRELCTDMARLEWAYIEAFDAADAAPLDAAKLAAIPGVRLGNRAHRARPRRSPARCALPGRPTCAARCAPAPSRCRFREPRAENLVIHRTQRSLFWQPVSRGAFELLRALAEGLPLVKSCERAIELVPAEAEAIETEHRRVVSGLGQTRLGGRRGSCLDRERTDPSQNFGRKQKCSSNPRWEALSSASWCG